MNLPDGFVWACPQTSDVWGVRRVGARRMLCGDVFFSRDGRPGYCPEGEMQPKGVPSLVCGRCLTRLRELTVVTAPPLLPEGFTAEPDLRGGWRLCRNGRFAGTVFPQVVPMPEGRWFARLPGKAVRLCPDQKAAVNHLTDHYAPKEAL